MFGTPNPLSQSTLTLEFTPTDDHFAVQPITTQKPYLWLDLRKLGLLLRYMNTLSNFSDIIRQFWVIANPVTIWMNSLSPSWCFSASGKVNGCACFMMLTNYLCCLLPFILASYESHMAHNFGLSPTSDIFCNNPCPPIVPQSLLFAELTWYYYCVQILIPGVVAALPTSNSPLVRGVLVADLELEGRYGCFRIVIGSIAKRTCESSGYGGLLALAYGVICLKQMSKCHVWDHKLVQCEWMYSLARLLSASWSELTDI